MPDIKVKHYFQNYALYITMNIGIKTWSVTGRRSLFPKRVVVICDSYVRRYRI